MNQFNDSIGLYSIRSIWRK